MASSIGLAPSHPPPPSPQTHQSKKPIRPSSKIPYRSCYMKIQNCKPNLKNSMLPPKNLKNLPLSFPYIKKPLIEALPMRPMNIPFSFIINFHSNLTLSLKLATASRIKFLKSHVLSRPFIRQLISSALLWDRSFHFFSPTRRQQHETNKV